VTTSWFIFHTELRCTVKHTSGLSYACCYYKFQELGIILVSSKEGFVSYLLVTYWWHQQWISEHAHGSTALAAETEVNSYNRAILYCNQTIT